VIERLSRGKRNLVLAVLAALLVWFCWTIRSVLNPLLLGYLCAFILAPLVVRIAGLGFSRRASVNFTFVGGFLLAGLVSLVLVLQMRSLALEVYRSATTPDVSEQLEEVGGGESDPTFQEKLQLRLTEFEGTLQGWGLDVGPWEIPDLQGLRDLAGGFLAEYEEELQVAAGKGFGFLARFLGGLVSVAGLFVLVPLYTYYFLFERERINAFVKRHLPIRDRERLARVAGKIGQAVSSFFRGRLAVCFLKGLVLSTGLLVAGVPYALLFGMLSGFLSIVPFFGPFLGFLLAFVVSLTEYQAGSALIRTGLVFGLGELIEGYVLLPRIIGNSLGLHPMVVFFALLAGGTAMGMLGILIAMPLMATIVILIDEFVLPALRDFADEEAPAGGTGS